MAANDACAACSWTHQRQESCRYESHVKLFYEVNDRGVWAVGSNLIVKEMSDTPPNLEARTTRFVQSNTTIPIPEIVQEWKEDGRHFLVTKRIQGITLKEAWPNMSETERDCVAKQTADYLGQIREFCSAKIQRLGGEPVYSAFFFLNGYGLPHGPFSSNDQLWQGMLEALTAKGVPERVCRLLQQRMPAATPYTLTHGDLNTANIIVRDGKVVGILDWESCGFFPTWWEFVSTAIAQDQDDRAWKTLLRKHLQDCTDAREFCLDYYALSRYPNLDSCGVGLIEDSERERE